MELELADIFRAFGNDYRQKYTDKLLSSHRQAMWAIERCRTEALGGQVYGCPSCHEVQYSYHSCRNRHCPKCQHELTQEWLKVQEELLLPVPYFLLTFTLPSQLRTLVSRNQKFMYALLFRASADATQQLALDPRHLGGQIGMVGVLHTWTRNLVYHPHIHYLVPGGGLSASGNWLSAQNKFFLPVRALSKLFRAAFRRGLENTPLFAQIEKSVWKKEWVVNCKAVGNNGQAALKYLAPYIHRVAISNRRLIKFSNTGNIETSQVSFRYRVSNTGQIKTCTLSAESFMHRFLQHILPHGFVKVRYYGFFGASVRTRLRSIQNLLALHTQPQQGAELTPESECADPQPKILCPRCGAPMSFRHDFTRNSSFCPIRPG
jgi:hypothetical protein